MMVTYPSVRCLMLNILLKVNKNYLIALQEVLIVCFNSVTMKSPGISVPPSALFTLEYLPEYKLSFQQFNCRAVLM